MNNNNFLWKSDEFDSRVLGIPTAKIQSIEIDEETPASSIERLVQDLEAHAISYAVYRLPASSFAVIHALESTGFVYVDGMLAMEIELNSINFETNQAIRVAQELDIPILQKMVKGIFKTRYYNDPVIPQEKVDNIFQEWVKNSVNHEVADEVLVYKDKETISGFVTLKKDGSVPLIGVSHDAQGKGIGKALIQAALQYHKTNGNKKAFIETQIANIAAIRSYQSCGFKVTESFLTFRWYKKS